MSHHDDQVRRTDDRAGEGTAPENQEHATEAAGAGAGALAGAGVGAVVGGPVGAAVGGVVGAVGGAIAGEAVDGDDEAGAGVGGGAGAVGGALIGGAVAGPPGAIVGGAVGAGAGAGLGDQAEEEVEEEAPTASARCPADAFRLTLTPMRERRRPPGVGDPTHGSADGDSSGAPATTSGRRGAAPVRHVVDPLRGRLHDMRLRLSGGCKAHPEVDHRARPGREGTIDATPSEGARPHDPFCEVHRRRCSRVTAYNQWTQFQQSPQFMEGVDRVVQLDDKTLQWTATVGADEGLDG